MLIYLTKTKKKKSLFRSFDIITTKIAEQQNTSFFVNEDSLNYVIHFLFVMHHLQKWYNYTACHLISSTCFVLCKNCRSTKKKSRQLARFDRNATKNTHTHTASSCELCGPCHKYMIYIWNYEMNMISSCMFCHNAMPCNYHLRSSNRHWIVILFFIDFNSINLTFDKSYNRICVCDFVFSSSFFIIFNWNELFIEFN